MNEIHPIKVAALYRFAPLDDFASHKAPLEALCRANGVRGTLLLAHEIYKDGRYLAAARRTAIDPTPGRRSSSAGGGEEGFPLVGHAGDGHGSVHRGDGR